RIHHNDWVFVNSPRCRMCAMRSAADDGQVSGPAPQYRRADIIDRCQVNHQGQSKNITSPYPVASSLLSLWRPPPSFPPSIPPPSSPCSSPLSSLWTPHSLASSIPHYLHHMKQDHKIQPRRVNHGGAFFAC